MTDASSRTLAALARELEEATGQAKLAYEFAPSCYSYSAMAACLSALEILGGYRGYFEGVACADK